MIENVVGLWLIQPAKRHLTPPVYRVKERSAEFSTSVSDYSQFELEALSRRSMFSFVFNMIVAAQPSPDGPGLHGNDHGGRFAASERRGHGEAAGATRRSREAA